MIIVPAGFAVGLAVDDAVGGVRAGIDEGAAEALSGDAGLPLGADSGAASVPHPAISKQNTTARLLIRQV
jgi:hypothetical protein